MTPIGAAALVVLMVLPLHWAVLRHFRQLGDPAYLRSQGVIVLRESPLDARSAPIGEYLGRPIPASVTFKTMRYRFDHVLDGRLRHRIGPGRLFLEPGLVYIVED